MFGTKGRILRYYLSYNVVLPFCYWEPPGSSGRVGAAGGSSVISIVVYHSLGDFASLKSRSAICPPPLAGQTDPTILCTPAD